MISDADIECGSPDNALRINPTLDIHKQLSEDVRLRPYDYRVYMHRQLYYSRNGYFDLAAGDAYKALLLLDEAEDPSGEYHEQASFILQKAFPIQDETRRRQGIARGIKSVYVRLIDNLILCGCLRTAYDFSQQGARRFSADETTKKLGDIVLQRWKKRLENHDNPTNASSLPSSDLPDRCLVRREVYPWNKLEPFRYDKDYRESLNARLQEIDAKCSVELVRLPTLNGDRKHRVEQLGLVATEYIEPGATILEERSLLTAQLDADPIRCDACSAVLPELSEIYSGFACSECAEAVFCSAECEQAGESYHPAVCGTELESLTSDIPQQETPDALYFNLLTRCFAMAETQDTHPLLLEETKSLWGEFEHVPDSDDVEPKQTLPFSFKYNVLLPLHALQRMGVDIFATTARYDFWVINTLYAKFRGVASARPNARTGKPEVAAVHPLWCLANHDCAPNVKWEWEGKMKLWARSEEEAVKWANADEKGNSRIGLKKGEQIRNHYCDVDLPVKERREWMLGPLGGECFCQRCSWEAAQEQIARE